MGKVYQMPEHTQLIPDITSANPERQKFNICVTLTYKHSDRSLLHYGHKHNPRLQCEHTKTNSVALSPRTNYTDWATATCRRNTQCEHKTYSVATSPQANYTDWATATYWRNLVPLLWVEGCRVVSAADPHGRYLSFLDRSCYFSFK
jgi:hypothetical protein